MQSLGYFVNLFLHTVKVPDNKDKKDERGLLSLQRVEKYKSSSFVLLLIFRPIAVRLNFPGDYSLKKVSLIPFSA
jgi:hypothetical protein